MGKHQHVVRRDDDWAVRGEGNSRDTSRHPTQREAIESAKETAKREQSDVIIHGTDGKFRERNSYGNDPYPPKG